MTSSYWLAAGSRRLISAWLPAVSGTRRPTSRNGGGAGHALKQQHLERFVEELVGKPLQIAHRWAGIFGVTTDRYALVGRVPGREDVWVACGYSCHGNVLGLVCGELVAEAILGRPAPELELFDPARLPG
jgi:glycine/D-amino acid oxidase-like deaminating enzyme